MHFIGVVTDKNSENNIKRMVNEKINNNNKIIFLTKENLSNFRNVKFDSLILNEKLDENLSLNQIMEKCRYILLNSDIYFKSDKTVKEYQKIITFGYNSKATVTISSATEDNYMIYIQDEISNSNKLDDIQEIKFEKTQSNINAYDGMIITIMDMLYNNVKK